jgi:beta-1,4-mannosyl-glycoprotein beta-1,4-N-acetylglucosaminyltransferase
MPKRIDVFTFYNELDMLELRLEMLDSFVDKFVIIECIETFSGKSKPLFYQENKERYKKWNHKIVHHVTYDPAKSFQDLQDRILSKDTDELTKQICIQALTSSNVPIGELHWLKEFYQKENIRRALIKANLDPQDLCFIGDLDEIWNTDLEYEAIDQLSIYKLKQIVYSGKMNMRSSEDWAGTLLTRYKNVENSCLSHLRNPSKTSYIYVENAGWHFTFMGGKEQIKKKLEAYGHQEYNNELVKSQIENRLENSQDVLGRNEFRYWLDESQLPEYILKNRDRYNNFF